MLRSCANMKARDINKRRRKQWCAFRERHRIARLPTLSLQHMTAALLLQIRSIMRRFGTTPSATLLLGAKLGLGLSGSLR